MATFWAAQVDTLYNIQYSIVQMYTQTVQMYTQIVQSYTQTVQMYT